MRFDIITIFPNLFASYLEETIIARAIRKKSLRVNLVDLRRFAKAGDAHRSVDGRPYGGGPGMILMVEPIAKALRALRIKNQESRIKGSDWPTASPLVGEARRGVRGRSKARVVMLSPDGKPFTQREAERLSKYDRLVLLCGRYEGFDARTVKLVDEKLSIGPYVLAGGELPAMVVLEAVARHVPGVVGHPEALKEETFSQGMDYVEYPQYTRPEKFVPAGLRLRGSDSRSKRGAAWRVPKILLSGDHKKIAAWRQARTK
ncbi:MAG: tRNA (guanine37-N1)-methyltransferase [Parcubacteria group bacterium Gr01-1014_31]|nr:MAG: tRNA (guanine37-N1)-methyltransferase [Parcubacteria group bacterium Gr01-1014_31]